MPTTPLGFVYPADSDYASSGADVPRAVQEGLESVDTYLTNFLGSLEGQYMLTGVFYITNPTTSYAPTAGTDALLIECIGGGGAGGGATTGATNGAAGGGGGGGGYAIKFTTSVKASYTVAVGAGGVGVSGANGGDGGNTTFDSPSICTGLGGGGGSVSAVGVATKMGGGGGSGGNGSVGDVLTRAGGGTWGVVLAAAEVGAGNGGNSFIGGGAHGLTNTTANGVAADSYGGGGAGATIISGGATKTGGNGFAGIIRVWEYKAVDPA